MIEPASSCVSIAHSASNKRSASTYGAPKRAKPLRLRGQLGISQGAGKAAARGAHMFRKTLAAEQHDVDARLIDRQVLIGDCAHLAAQAGHARIVDRLLIKSSEADLAVAESSGGDMLQAELGRTSIVGGGAIGARQQER